MSPSRWAEPTAALHLNWGTYRGRYLAGLALIVTGSVCLQGADPFTLQLLLAGTVAHSVGWLVLPTPGWRRLVVVLPALAVTWLLLTGPQSLLGVTVYLFCWLLVRSRPLASYLSLIFVAATGIVLAQAYREYAEMPIALVISGLVLVASAWIARAIAVSATRRSPRTV